LLVNYKDDLETIGNLFCGLGQDNDAKLVEELVEIYRLWVKNLARTSYGIELALAM